MKITKRIIYSLMLAALSVSVVFLNSACNSNNDRNDTENKSSSSVNESSVINSSITSDSLVASDSTTSSDSLITIDSTTTNSVSTSSDSTTISDSLIASNGNSSSQAISSSNKQEEEKPTPAKMSDRECILHYVKTQNDFSAYKTVTNGTTNTKVGFINYNQTSQNTTYKSGEEYFQECVSKSTFVNMTHQAFIKGNKAVYRNSSSGELTSVSKNEYKSIYGVSPDDEAIGGFIVNNDTLKSVNLNSKSGDNYTYKIDLDGQAASINMVKQMKEFGGLNDYPEILTLTLYLTIDSNWTPSKLVIESTYNISIAVLGNKTCSHNFTTEYFNVNGAITIPNIDEFRQKL